VFVGCVMSFVCGYVFVLCLCVCVCVFVFVCNVCVLVGSEWECVTVCELEHV